MGKLGILLLEFIKIAVLAGITIGFVRYFLFKPFYVKGQSMEPTFEERDYLIIDELSYRFHEPSRGDVIVLHYRPSDDYYLKRIIGLPGERIKVDGNKVVIYNEAHPQGMVLPEGYLTEATPGSVTITLGNDQFFVMGDNRDASFDSRRFGAIDRDDVVGRVWVRGWPFSRVSTFSRPSYNL
ncbi:MAG: signal peptidase I [Candidatus Magasanikbacteria bacterium RIFCSPHIGHO2_01_FULL_41_23]|uniref:Signal peptidase I n=1 Tax=Candidatus Magasanikbacteria bacterium RIFCSPLOWO2_01_FULL_40_15 TaxID=1798686 RepID=A0A1F6N4F4_9BACT|nr:MAG: signal peptidase I [Candidatus Magasanikbacteria bacterium RIFCSPHIGHO2_01_FULL_41_23]OGH67219.1 MAG: signal peptidase I [Candidatus Magasanikbacteria bacterium RIFCSPHIGHO2_02_FULL_41_35]OGH76745.1 MAG: signal peptidase I [Candidatus Magasanikbacteria bacterium RIFCSPHIGHO2_12_FULL_41_16]OGH78754.1 MAG: signal peptidase I [Candidatus Magasanikbacteria bacterium RIFCSPLOWO2_01_FULL_40_15]